MIRRLLLTLTVVVGCSSEATNDPQPAQTACDPPALRLPDGACIRPGIPENGCGGGVEHDGAYGCVPVLRAGSCPPGQLAVPGEESCRGVMECADGTWGSLPIDADTVHVDASDTAADADGMVDRPWPTVAQAIAKAPTGGLVAVAAGQYPASLTIAGAPLRLWGVCPGRVSLVGTDDGATLTIGAGADGTEVGGLALTGPGRGLLLGGAANVVVDRVRIHDNLDRGISAVPRRSRPDPPRICA